MIDRYRRYDLGEVGEEAMCGEMVTMNRGVSIEELHAAANAFFEKVVRPRVFPEMRELTHRLRDGGTELWAVSSTNNWVVEAGAVHFGFSRDHVLAACVLADGGRATDRLVRVPTDELKAIAIQEVIGRPVDAVFGNSVHDLAMLELAAHPFCVNPNPDLRENCKVQKLADLLANFNQTARQRIRPDKPLRFRIRIDIVSDFFLREGEKVDPALDRQ